MVLDVVESGLSYLNSGLNETAYEYRNDAFTSNREYVYHYETQVMSAIKTASRQLTGLKIRSQVHLFFQNQMAYIKLQNIKVFELDEVIPASQQHGFLPEYLLRPVPYEVEKSIMAELTKPIKFQYDQGAVIDIFHASDDSDWSINIKKGVISALQLRVANKWQQSGSSLVSSAERSTDTKSPVKVFETVETDVLGKCTSTYAIYHSTGRLPDPFQASLPSNDAVVRKVRDSAGCIKVYGKPVGLYAGLPHLAEEKDLIDGSVTVESHISGNLENFLIKKVEVKGKYHFTPYVEEGGHVSTQVLLVIHSFIR
ncbi:hypothetical protein HELRODRAFT_182125 [Helobdella robusta]|uniref:Vitellogenin domain-containing protein n=1 Tax=Helobdella robusta TaxID=6412 RepID=T1FHS9_HELRO|nr:hypothetical protein HELRODRAFT_182125 [Helobdella robusta]ESN91267.1 hypothetical protein HELRODRAFT_182125 [Helobdella robusta]